MSFVSKIHVSHGSEWHDIVCEAARLLLTPYELRWKGELPINPYRLAWCVRARVRRVAGLEGPAYLMPVVGGFHLLIASGTRPFALRTAVAHEIVHSLFYDNTARIPSRLASGSEREEAFCREVARRLLAPRWALEKITLSSDSHVSEMMNAVIAGLGITIPVASRVLLEDYALVVGVAGTWREVNSCGVPVSSGAHATRCLSRKERTDLRKLGTWWLNSSNRGALPKRYMIAATDYGEGVKFVVVALSPSFSTTSTAFRE